MSVIDTTVKTERLPGPEPANRTCRSCSAKLSRNNPGRVCAPCNGGEWEIPEQPHPAQVARIGMERGLEELGVAA